MRDDHQPKANKTDAGNGSKAICPVSNVLRSPSPDPSRSVIKLAMLYAVTAFALSFLWLAALAFAPGIGIAIRGGTEEVFSLPRQVVWILFPVISVFIALTFKRWILSCRRWRMLLPAFALPWIGTLVIAFACGITAHTMRSDPNGGLFGALWFAVIYTVVGIWIVFPMGLVSQFSLLTADRLAKIGTEQSSAGQPATRFESDSEGGDKPQPEAEWRSR
jgi:hypothetical protein